MNATWPARVALVAALAAPLLAATAPADAALRPFPVCKVGQAQYAPAPGRAYIPERPYTPRVRVCRKLRPIAVTFR